MVLYILPEFKEKFIKLVDRASKHLEVKPTMTFSEPMVKTKKTVIAWKRDGEHGFDKYKEVITVIEVNIDDITSGDWVLVADVFFKEEVIGMMNAKYYKDIPSYLGLDYVKCDYCGHIHPNRTKSHIVYNTATGEWKQIGTACGKKMFNAGDICKFTIKLYEVIQETLACVGEENWAGWCGRIPDHSWKKAYSVDSIIPAVVGYRKDVNPEWEKSYYDYADSYRTKHPGTTTFLTDYYLDRQTTHDVVAADGTTYHYDALVIDEDYNNKVRAFVKTLADDYEKDKWGDTIYERPGFKSGIKMAFENGYIQLNEVAKVFFAVKMYEESLTFGDWEKMISNITVGEKNDFRGVKMVSKEWYEDFYGCGYEAKFITPEGLVISKSFSNWDGFESKFKNEDGTYSFKARVDFINNNKRTIKLGGRVSKIN